MKTIDLEKKKTKLSQIFNFAQREPVLLITDNGQKFILSRADDFGAEKEDNFKTLLNERKVRFPI